MERELSLEEIATILLLLVYDCHRENITPLRPMLQGGLFAQILPRTCGHHDCVTQSIARAEHLMVITRAVEIDGDEYRLTERGIELAKKAEHLLNQSLN